MPPLDRPVRIANCSGFYGDRLSAAQELVSGGEIDVLTGDYLAELTMLILTRDRMKDASLGYAKTFLRQIADVLSPCLERGIRIVSNAGGTNPKALAAELRTAAEAAGLHPKIAVVTGDDILRLISDWNDAGELRHLETGAALRPQDGMPMAANAYLGCWGIAEALRRGADIVITGRVTDAATVMGPAAWAHGWARDDWDALAGALAAGHVIECGCQATGGNYAFFDEVPSFQDVGFPIAEIDARGHAVITKHEGTGGLVSVGTVTAQLLYEIGGARYASPDVIARLDTIVLQQQGPDRVSLTGTKGEPAPNTLKAGVLLATGWRNQVTLLLGGGDVAKKARIIDETFWPCVGGKASYQTARTDVIVADPAQNAPHLRLSRVVLSARDLDARKVGRAFGARAIEMALASVPGLTLDALPGKPRATGVFWPCLVPRERVPHQLHIDDELIEMAHPEPSEQTPPATPTPIPPQDWSPEGVTSQVPLGTLVGARSGDKAGNANVGFWVKTTEHYEWLRHLIREETLRGWLDGFSGPIRVHALPNLLAINVELVGWLDQGVAANLAPDPQAKCLAECLRTVLVTVDETMLAGRTSSH